MAKAVLICGRICCGKTTYAQTLCKDRCAVLLSVDEIMLGIFGQHCGDKHDEYAAAVREYLLGKSLELVGCGVDAVLDWGFWTKAGRDEVRAFYAAHGVECELRYLNIGDDEWRRRTEKRNSEVLEGRATAYYVDENLAAKAASRFEEPDDDEVDVFI